MKTLILFGVTALLSTPILTAAAAPYCDTPIYEKGERMFSDAELAQQAERELHRRGIDATNTRFWNGCLQTFVKDENGKSVIKFYNPDSYAELPAK